MWKENQVNVIPGDVLELVPKTKKKKKKKKIKKKKKKKKKKFEFLKNF
jgi:hypothetical protein